MDYIRQTESANPTYSLQDCCLVCGCYLPEGAGMVCQNCLATAPVPTQTTD